MKTLEQAAEIQGVTLKGTNTLELQFSPMPNWYMFDGVTCPRCGNDITWYWEGEKPGITTPETVKHLVLAVEGATLVADGHRWHEVVCDKCQTILKCHNFDY